MYRLLTLCILLATTSMSFASNTDKAMVLVQKINTQELFDQYTYPARVESNVNTTVLAEGEGVVSHISVVLGQKIKKGQKILTITNTDPVYQYAPVVIVAPISGVISQLEVTEGTQVNKGQKVAYITDPDKIKITVEVPANEVIALKNVQDGQFSVNSDSVKVHLVGISPTIDPATGTANCELIPLKKQNLVPGMIGQVQFKSGLKQGITVPEQALVQKSNETYIRVVDNNRVKFVNVQTGKRQNGQIEITKGLHSGQTIVEKASRYINDDEEVVSQVSGSSERK